MYNCTHSSVFLPTLCDEVEGLGDDSDSECSTTNTYPVKFGIDRSSQVYRISSLRIGNLGSTVLEVRMTEFGSLLGTDAVCETRRRSWGTSAWQHTG